MTVDVWLAFALASAVLLAVPGPTILTVISYSVRHGSRVSAALVCAVALGDATALCASMLGVGALLKASAFWFTVVKVLGGVYLLYLGIQMLRAGVAAPETDRACSTSSTWRAFVNTYLVTALNPKGMVFFVAFLPLFISPAGNVPQQLWVLASTFVALATLSTFLYAQFATTARRFIASDHMLKRFKLTGGTMLSVAGLWALLSRQPVQ